MAKKKAASRIKGPDAQKKARNIVKTSKADPESPAKPKRGRTNIPGPQTEAPTHRTTPVEQKTQGTRPVGPGAGIRRGDRRDTHTLYTGNAKHSRRGNTPRPNVETRRG